MVCWSDRHLWPCIVCKDFTTRSQFRRSHNGTIPTLPTASFMTRYIVFLATLLALRMIAQRGLSQAVLLVWIPIFLAFPFNFAVTIPGLPDPNLMQAAILPILVVLVRDKRPLMQFGRMEILLTIYVVFRVFVDFLNRGYSDAQNYAFYMLSSLIGPYLIGRYVIDKRQMDIAAARMFVLMFVIFFPMFVYELKFWVSPVYKLFGIFFPGAGSGLSVRYGVARTAGTFEHPILACVMIVVVYRLHRWLTWVGEWDKPQRGWLGWLDQNTRWMRIPLATKISILLILMAIMTISRGPWIGGLIGAAMTAVGNFKNRKKWLVIFTLALVMGGGAGKMALDSYITPKEGQVISGEAQTMLYRKEMIDRYKEFMYEKMWTGWGLTTRPKIKGMESIDNAFFLMALQHGLPAMLIFVTIFLYAITSQIKFGLKAPPGESPLGFTFAGIYLAAFISFATVYMGAHTEPMLFLLLGWGESIKNRNETGISTRPATTRQHSGINAPFRRILY